MDKTRGFRISGKNSKTRGANILKLHFYSRVFIFAKIRANKYTANKVHKNYTVSEANFYPTDYLWWIEIAKK